MHQSTLIEALARTPSAEATNGKARDQRWVGRVVATRPPVSAEGESLKKPTEVIDSTGDCPGELLMGAGATVEEAAEGAEAVAKSDNAKSSMIPYNVLLVVGTDAGNRRN